MKILFVCSSNICRSPYCEYMFKRDIAADAKLAEAVESVRSAAVFNRSKAIHPKARLALLREGFDEKQIDAHRPSFKRGDEALFDDADIIVGMTKSNGLFLPRRYRGKFITLSQWVDGKYTKIPDPFLMKNMADYYAVMDVIKAYLGRLEEKLRAQIDAVGAPVNPLI